MEDSYEMVPYKDILELKKDIEELKKGGGTELIASMRSLTSVINELIALLKEAAKGMAEDNSNSLKSISDKLDNIISQNEKIADGLVAIGDMMENNKSKMPSFNPLQPPIMPQAMPPISPQIEFSAPPSDMNTPQAGQTIQREMPDIDGFNFNPPPPITGMPNFPEPKRRRLFGRFRK